MYSIKADLNIEIQQKFIGTYFVLKLSAKIVLNDHLAKRMRPSLCRRAVITLAEVVTSQIKV